MPYPISIKNETTIHLDNSTKYEDIVNGLNEDLIKLGNEIELRDNRIRLVRCPEFSSRTGFKEFNNGLITLTKSDNRVKVIFKIYLVEHLIPFFGATALGTYGLIENGVDSLMLKIALLMLMASFVFLYLMPFMTLNPLSKSL